MRNDSFHKRRLEHLLPAAAFALALPIRRGCSSQHTETTTTETRPAGEVSSTTTTTSSADHDSLLGAFPFRVVGDVIGEIV